jgi:KUP system potassium uptake protein
MTSSIALAAEPDHRSGPSALALAALGVVYGDIGTSPLYAFKECLSPDRGMTLDPASVLGVLSLIFWALMIVVSLKYVTLVMRADNQGEGGILALLALALRGFADRSRARLILVMLGLIGASMFYGDSVITPAISVLSAVEGLEIATPAFTRFVVPITLAILVGLFIIQKQGTAKVGKMFGPVMVVWFLTLAAAGVSQIIRHPGVLSALNPVYAVSFMASDPVKGFFLLGAVFLAMTGGEALYADMGHFGLKPIRTAWFGLVLPALVLNYFGQGALVLADPTAIKNPFYLSFPAWSLLPMVVLSAVATVIASQAVISGAYSLTAQAVKLGYSPRMRILHTSASERGQIYVPFINWLLFVAVALLVLGFRTSGNLAAAYGIAVAMTMVVTTILCSVVAIRTWHWRPLFVYLVFGALSVVDVAFVLANSVKVAEGGWFPILAGSVCYLLFITWKRGKEILADATAANSFPLEEFIKSMESYPPHRVEGTAVFMAADPHAVPHALLHNLKHNKVLHQTVVFFTIHTEDVPRVAEADRLEFTDLGFGCYRVIAHLGFVEETNAEELLTRCSRFGLNFEPMLTSYFLSRDAVVPTALPGMALWREHLFAWMVKNATRATDFFKIPANRVVELGSQVEI